jgi:hypothetical protein
MLRVMIADRAERMGRGLSFTPASVPPGWAGPRAGGKKHNKFKAEGGGHCGRFSLSFAKAKAKFGWSRPLGAPLPAPPHGFLPLPAPSFGPPPVGRSKD